MEWVKSVLHNQDAMLWAMAFVVFLLTQVLKLPIKFFTKKITKEQARKAVNSTILLLPFVLGCVLQFLYDHYVLHCAFDWTTGFVLGGQSMAFYGIIEHFLGIKLPNELETTEEGQAVLEQVEEAKADGVVTKDEVKEIVENTVKVKKSKKKSKVESESVDETPQEVKDFINKIDLGSK